MQSLTSVTWALCVAAVIVGLVAARAVLRRRRRRGDYGDDVVTLFCRHCHREPGQECTCQRDCGRPDCPWPLWNALRTDAEISSWLETLKGKDSL